MSWWDAALLGLVQGLTEFLPVSSSGHLVVAQAALGVEAPGVLVEVVLHVGTLTAVIAVYWRRVLELVRGMLTRRRDAWRYVGLLVVATLPAAAIGVGLADVVERAFESLTIVGVAFLVTGSLLWSTRRLGGTRSEPTLLAALLVGTAQAMAIVPGISRSGFTIATALWTDVEPVRAAEFSFLLAVAAIAGAAVLEVPHLGAGAAAVGWDALAIGFVVALLSGIAAIRLLVRLLARRAFHQFAPYCWVIGVLTLGWAILR